MPIVTVNLTNEGLRLSEPLRRSSQFSKWIDNKIILELKDSRVLKVEIEKLEEQKKQLLEQLRLVTEYEKKDKEIIENRENITPDQMKYWEDTIKILDRDITFLPGRKNLYESLFGHSLTKIQFLEKLEAVKNKIKKERGKNVQ